jgi:orotate phosphoribosyltransferase
MDMADTVEQMFEKSGALLKGHFLLTSGLHSPVYWEKSLVVQYPEYTEELCRMIADRFRNSGAQVVAGPTTPGIILAYETARQLGVRGIFAERDESGSGRVFRRGFKIDPSEKVLVVDDVMTTGNSVREVIDAVK